MPRTDPLTDFQRFDSERWRADVRVLGEGAGSRATRERLTAV